MNFIFVFCIPWILSIARLRKNNVKRNCAVLFVLCVCSTIVDATDNGEPLNKEFLIKSHKVIEAVPHILKRVHSSTSFSLPEDWDCRSVSACDDPMGYEAIRSLHRQLDDDANGSIDVSETDEFLRDELQYENGRHKERHKEFHGNDKYINVDELWQIWRISEVHNWTVDQTVEWLITQVDLPQYEHNFRNNGVNGAFLPLLAQNTHNFISQNLGIKDSINKQKISLKAMDVVLFGKPKYHNYLKDVLLAMSLVIATGGCWFAYVQHKHSQLHMQRMMKDMEALQRAEDSLQDLQKELNKAKHEQEIVSIEKQDLERRLKDEMITSKKYLEHSFSGCSEEVGDPSRLLELEQELVVARSDLREVERKLEARHWIAPSALQHWLQFTHELELRNYNVKKAVAEQQLLAAKEGCEKLSKKRATFIGAFRIAHGSSIDDVDDRIFKAKSALYEVTTDLQERMNRWKQIELLCGVPIIVNPGLTVLENVLKLHTMNMSRSESSHSDLNTLGKSSSNATLREDSPGPYAGVIPSSLPPPHSFTKTSPSYARRNPDLFTASIMYPKECYRTLETVSSFETDNEEMQLVEVESDFVDTPPSTNRPVFTLDGLSGDSPMPKVRDSEVPTTPTSSRPQLCTEQQHPNGKMSDFVRKISASLLEKKKKPLSSVVEALKKSSSSSNIVDDGASSESSSSTVSEEKNKKKKFFQTLRQKKLPKS